MKNKRNIFFSLIMFVIMSCNSTSDSVNLDGSYSRVEYLENVSLLLSDLEGDIVLSLNQSNSIEEFEGSIQEMIELKYNKQELKSIIVDENISEKELLISQAFCNFKASIYYEYDEIKVDGSKEEFFEYLRFRKENLINETELLTLLDDQREKDIFIALMCLEIGTFEILVNYFEEIIALDQNSSENGFKSAYSCNWWCRTKKYAECALLTETAALGFVATILGPPPYDILGAFATTMITPFAINCWEDYFYNYI